MTYIAILIFFGILHMNFTMASFVKDPINHQAGFLYYVEINYSFFYI